MREKAGLEARDMLAPGMRIGRYLVRRRLAEGGMAELFVAEALGPDGFSKDVVLKVVRQSLSADPHFAALFAAEARFGARLNHPNVVQVFDYGSASGIPYIAMEYVRGGSLWTLRAQCRRLGRPFPPMLAAHVGALVASGLDAAHGATERGRPLGLVHRDVSPHNILLSFHGDVKLTDFGVAKGGDAGTAPGVLKGKFAYMSPEQAAGEPVDARADLFALGAVLWELLTGGRLFDAPTEIETLRAVAQRAIAPPCRLNGDVPEALSDVVMGALARPLAQRTRRAADLARDLHAVVHAHAHSASDTDVAAFVRTLLPDAYEALVRSGTEVALPSAPEASEEHGDPLDAQPSSGTGPPAHASLSAELAPTHVVDRHAAPRARTEPLPRAEGSSPGEPAAAAEAGAAVPARPAAERPSSTGRAAGEAPDGPGHTEPLPPLRHLVPTRPVEAPLVELVDRLASEAATPAVPTEAPRASNGLTDRSETAIGEAETGARGGSTGGVLVARQGCGPPRPSVAGSHRPSQQVREAARRSRAALSVPGPASDDPQGDRRAQTRPLAPRDERRLAAAAAALAFIAGALGWSFSRAATAPETPLGVHPQGGAPSASGVASPGVPSLGSLEVRARPYADVVLDGQALGQVSSARLFVVSAGTRSLELVHPLRTAHHRIDVIAGAHIVIDFDAAAPALGPAGGAPAALDAHRRSE